MATPTRKLYAKHRRNTAVGFSPEGVPAELKTYPAWVLWRHEQRDGKLTKVPFTPGAGTRASTTDMRTWRSFEEAVEAYEAGGYDGVGFVFSSGDPFAGVDLDGVRNPQTGELAPRAQKIVEALGGHVEVSPSGTGVHLIVRGEAPNKKRGPLEMYSSRRFFTVSGKVLP